jgi:hypothetical protein
LLRGQCGVDGALRADHVRVLLDRNRRPARRSSTRSDQRGPTVQLGLLTGDGTLQVRLVRPPDVMEHPFRSKWSTRSDGNEAVVPE